MNTNSYYIIKQSLPYLETKINKVYCPCNEIHLKKLISFMIGIIEVYLYNEENGKREDLTETLGTRDFNLYEHKFEHLKTVKMIYSHKHFVNKYFLFYSFVALLVIYLNFL